MKKLLSVLVAVMMTVSVLTLTTVTSFAAPSPEGTPAENKRPVLQVNGVTNSTDISYTQNPNEPTEFVFTYDGEGELQGWETNLEELGFVEGTDYTIETLDDGSLKIKFISEASYNSFLDGTVNIDAIVDFGDDNGEDNDETTKPADKDNSNKSPNTGIATTVVAGSVAVAGAGFAVLSATKKRDAE